MALETSSTRPIAAPQRSANILDTIALILMIVGGLNWGLVGLFDFDLVARLLGPMSIPSRVVYVLVGVAALWGFVVLARRSRD